MCRMTENRLFSRSRERSWEVVGKSLLRCVLTLSEFFSIDILWQFRQIPGVVAVFSCESFTTVGEIAERFGTVSTAVCEVECNAENHRGNPAAHGSQLSPSVLAAMKISKKENSVLILRNAHHRSVVQLLHGIRRQLNGSEFLRSQGEASGTHHPITLVLDGWTAPWVIAPEYEEDFRKILVGSLPSCSLNTGCASLEATPGGVADLDCIEIAEVCEEYPMRREEAIRILESHRRISGGKGAISEERFGKVTDSEQQ